MSSSAFSNIPTRVYIGIETLTGNFDFSSSQDGYYLRWTGTNDITGTFRTDATHPITNASVFTVYQAGAGIITITGASGVTINGPNESAGQYSAIQAIKSATDIFDVVGGIT
jgi:hypothetical protein